MINKQALLDAISQAIDSMGGDLGDGDEYGENDSMGGDNPVPVWSQLQATSPMGQSPGIIHDKSALMNMGMDRTSKPPQVDNYNMPVDDEQSEMMSALGMV